MTEPIKTVSILKNYLKQNYLVHYADTQEIIHILNSLQLMCDNPDLENINVSLHKVMFLSKLLTTLHTNMNTQPKIIDKITYSITLFLRKLKNIGDAEEARLINPILRHINENGSIELENVLPRFLDSFSMLQGWSSHQHYGQQYSSIIPWSLSHFVEVHPDLAQTIAESFSADLEFMPSIVACMLLSQQLLNSYIVSTMNSKKILYFNQIVFWTLTLHMFHHCIYNRTIMHRISVLSRLVKIEVLNVYEWINAKANRKYISRPNIRVVLSNLIMSEPLEAQLGYLDLKEIILACQNLTVQLSSFCNHVRL